MAKVKSVKKKNNVLRTNKFSMMRMINSASSEMMSRIGGRLGQSWFSDTTGRARRNLYEALGYIKSPVFEDYMSRYIRGDVAKRIVDAEPNACWRLSPTITETKVEGVEDSKKQTLFEKDLIALLNRMNIFHYLYFYILLCLTFFLFLINFGRDGKIRTCDLVLPRHAS